MAGNSRIEWTDATFNPWLGCQKVSGACDHCYAEALALRWKSVKWGPRAVRKRTSEANWRKPLVWNRQAEKAGRSARVFCASLADVFDNKAPKGAREDLWDLIGECTWLDWQLLTKRPQNIRKMLPLNWDVGWEYVWLGTTTENQKEYNRRWPALWEIPAWVRFISYEPALGSLSLKPLMDSYGLPDWVIIGGESGPHARPLNPRWVQELIEECEELGVAVFLKQWGSWASNPLVQLGTPVAEVKESDPYGKGGALLDGNLIREFPVSWNRRGGEAIIW